MQNNFEAEGSDGFVIPCLLSREERRTSDNNRLNASSLRSSAYARFVRVAHGQEKYRCAPGLASANRAFGPTSFNLYVICNGAKRLPSDFRNFFLNNVLYITSMNLFLQFQEFQLSLVYVVVFIFFYKHKF